jgi:hypothetical protein
VSFTIKFRSVVSGNDVQAVDKTVEVTADGLDSREVQITVGSDREVSVAFTLAALKGYYIVSDQALTLETNSSSAPTDTIILAAGKPLVWNESSGNAKHFTADVTKFFFTNAAAVTANVSIRVAKDATP